MLLAIQLALLAVGVIVVIRGRMSGTRGGEVVGVRARAAGGVLGGMAGWSTATGLMLERVPEGVQRLGVLGWQAVWLLGAMVLASMIAGGGRPVGAMRRAGGRAATA
jgi:hypothetical protein